MAIASSSASLSGVSSKNGVAGANRSTAALDFYESMYHFKKMFPKLDSDVIETILRANNGQVDKTLDQLLTLNVDTELVEQRRQSDPSVVTTTTNSTITTTQTSNSSENIINHDDSPPPYHELVKSSQSSLSSSAAAASAYFSSPVESVEQQSIIRSEPKEEPVGATATVTATAAASANTTGLYPFEVRVNWRNRVMIGELRRDFLRIQLTNEQMKKFKASIKKAKRDEITALVNNVGVIYVREGDKK